MKNKCLVILLFTTTIGCNKKPNTLEYELWKLNVDTAGVNAFDRRGGRLSFAFDFINDSIVDTKRPYFKITPRKDSSRWNNFDYHFIGTKTKYFFKKDSLFIYDLTKQKWTNEGKFSKVSAELIRLTGSEGIREFKKTHYLISKTPVFDRIVFSSSICFGSCPSLNISIDKAGKVIFRGNYNTDSLGLFEANIPKEEFERIEISFRLINPLKLKNYYDGNWTDDFTNNVLFCKGNKIVKSVSDYGEVGPDEWIWACHEIDNLYQKLKLKRVPRSALPYYLNYSFRYDSPNSQISLLGDFVFWNALREGKIVDAKFDEKIEVRFFQNLIRENEIEGYEVTRLLSQTLEKVTTDGRFFRFSDNKGKATTIDIGYNYFETNMMPVP